MKPLPDRRSFREDAQTAYWDGVAGTAVFTQPLHPDRFARYVGRRDPILDFGCGYGRVLEELHALGFTSLTGVDTSPGMAARARTRVPAARVLVAGEPPLPFPDHTFQCVLLFAVLTCLVGEVSRRVVMQEAFRVLRPGGILHVADFPIQTDAARRARYERFAPKYGVPGAFETEDGAALRHLEPGEWADLVAPFTQLEFLTMPVPTMRGNEAIGFQYVGRRPVEAG